MVKETAIQNLAKFPWFNLGNVFSHGKYVIIYKSQYWCCRNSPPYWNSWQFPIITRLRNSSLVLLGRTSSSWDFGITPEGGRDKTQTVQTMQPVQTAQTAILDLENWVLCLSWVAAEDKRLSGGQEKKQMLTGQQSHSTPHDPLYLRYIHLFGPRKKCHQMTSHLILGDHGILHTIWKTNK